MPGVLHRTAGSAATGAGPGEEQVPHGMVSLQRFQEVDGTDLKMTSDGVHINNLLGLCHLSIHYMFLLPQFQRPFGKRESE